MRKDRIQAVVLLLAVAAAACSRGDGGAPSPPGAQAAGPTGASARPSVSRATAPASPDEAGEAIVSLAALVKLAAQEYALAVDDSGAVKNDTELAEADLFTDQASFKYQRLAGQVKAGSDEERRAAALCIDALASAVAARRPPSEVRRLAQEATQALAGLGPTESAAIVGLRIATDEADRAIEAETLADDYRIGVFVEPPRRIFRRGAAGEVVEAPAPGGAASYLGVVLRERRSKRFLADSRVTVEIADAGGRPGGSLVLEPLSGDFPQYGGHLPPLAFSSGKLRVRVEPPHHARHGDMLARVAKPASVELDWQAVEGRLAVAPDPPQPADADYRLGDDILEGFAAAQQVVSTGGYRIGFIPEPPEPFWLWGDRPTLKAVREDDTHHLEIVLQDLTSGLLVPDAAVTLTLTPASGGEPIVTPLHSLLSAFQHYGETLRVPPGEYRVRVDVAPPELAAVDAPRFLGAARTEFDWRVEAAGRQTKG